MGILVNKPAALKKQVWRKNTKIVKSLCHVERNLYSHQDFKLRLAIEKRRAERSNSTSSIILFDLTNLVNGRGKLLKLEEVTRLVCRTIRITDVGMLYKKQAVVLLLPDTDSSGAERLCARMMQNMIDFYAANIALAVDDFHIKILSFPEQRIDSIDVENIIAENVDFHATEFSPKIAFQADRSFKKEYRDTLRLCESSFNAAALSISLDDIFFSDLQFVTNYKLMLQHGIKKMMDFCGSLAALIIFMPLMLIIALAIKLSSPGPVIFKQVRVGYRGKKFTFLKFRSMKCENEDNIHQEYVKKLINGETAQLNKGSEKNPCYKMNDDPRTTAFGRFLRKTSLDELPQLFNVLKGEMSLVGPRPPLEYEVNEYKLWHWRRMMQVKPGITGLWQVSGRNSILFSDMVRLDLYYAENWSIIMDLKILLKTIFVVFAADGN